MAHSNRGKSFSFVLFIYLFYLSLAVLGLRCFSLVTICKLLTVVASLVVEQGFKGTWASVVAAHGLSSCSSWALEHRFNSFGAWAKLLWHVGSSQIRD